MGETGEQSVPQEISHPEISTSPSELILQPDQPDPVLESELPVSQPETSQNQESKEHSSFLGRVFTRVKDRFHSKDHPVMQDPKSTESGKKISRRNFLKKLGRGAIATTALASSPLALEGVPHIAAIGERLLLKGVHSAAYERNDNWKNFFESAEEYIDHEGPMRVVIPEKFGGLAWKPDELELINNIVNLSLEQIEQTYGEKPEWTNNETTIVADDVLGYIQANQDVGAAFLDGDMMTDDIFQKRKLLESINLLLVPRPLIEELRSDDTSNAVFSFKTATIAHEIDHAYNQYRLFPHIIREGLADMSGNIMHRALDPEMAQYMETEKYTKQLSEVNSNANIHNRRFEDIVESNPFVAEKIYNASGLLFTQWHDQHPDFFKSMRQLENKEYAENKKEPTFEDWIRRGETIEPGFRNWINSQPLFNIRD